MQIHGGDSYRNQITLDFSVNVNPFGMPQNVKNALIHAVETGDKYPDMIAEDLTKAVSAAYAVSPKYLLFGNGSSELFMAVVHALKPQKTVIPVPSFYGYEYAAKASGGEIVYYQTTPENSFCLTNAFLDTLPKHTDLLFLANPNNPTGTLIEKNLLKRLLDYCKEQNIYVVLDECFIEFCDGAYSMLSEIAMYDNLLLVRAFTKIFSIPGVRLGYLVCSNQELISNIKRHIPEWNLSCFAQAAGCACCDTAVQSAFLKNTVVSVKKERQFLENELRKKGFWVFESNANFILLYSKSPLYERLLSHGILIRDCSNFRGLGNGYYRIAVKTGTENETLLNTIGGL